jgi:hypothetical protein
VRSTLTAPRHKFIFEQGQPPVFSVTFSGSSCPFVAACSPAIKATVSKAQKSNAMVTLNANVALSISVAWFSPPRKFAMETGYQAQVSQVTNRDKLFYVMGHNWFEPNFCARLAS